MSASFSAPPAEELELFWNELDTEHKGSLTREEFQLGIGAALGQLQPCSAVDLDHFVDYVLGERNATKVNQIIAKGDFIELVKARGLHASRGSELTSIDSISEARQYDHALSWTRRLRAWWSVKGSQFLFVNGVSLFVAGMSIWQGVNYATSPVMMSALGGGVVVAKFAAGALYPLFFFLVLSMSRWFTTFCRRSTAVSHFVNWDLSRTFHIRIGLLALFFSCLHAIGHLAGSFVHGSRASSQPAIGELWGPEAVPKTYHDFISSRPGWSGFICLGSLALVAITSTQRVRRWSYELFQLFHLLMFPVLAMLGAHGTQHWLQKPMLGYWLIFPTVLVAVERCVRLVKTFAFHHRATIEVLDDGTTLMTIDKPRGRVWSARAGQYVLIQVPALRRFQWHAFTVSHVEGGRLQVHVKKGGRWSGSLIPLAQSLRQDQGEKAIPTIKVGIDGPFGAPAQRFYNFDRSLIIGAGIGVTPFAALLSDLEQNYKAHGYAWKPKPLRGSCKRIARTPSLPHPPADDQRTLVGDASPSKSKEDVVVATAVSSTQASSYEASIPPESARYRVDFHWTVRSRGHLLWFSDLINRVSSFTTTPGSDLILNIRPHVTGVEKTASKRVISSLLDSQRFSNNDGCSALTGLAVPVELGRPDYALIIRNFYEDMKRQEWRGQVGVFFCGPSEPAKMLADLCAEYTARARQDGNCMRFVMMVEVFG